MIEPIYNLLVQLAQARRSGMLLLVMTASGSASHIVTLWLRDGEMVHVSDRMRRVGAALLTLKHARLLRRWQCWPTARCCLLRSPSRLLLVFSPMSLRCLR